LANRHALSKYLSFVLRHHPETIGLELATDGSVDIDALLAAMARHDRPLDRATLEELVASSDKQRFAISADGTRIRANQGHSVEVELGLTPLPPPAVLFHGTVSRFLSSIRARGLLKGERHHVHLSESREVAAAVGSRRGKAIVLVVDAAGMAASGFLFFRSANGVWLTEQVPPSFIVDPPQT
jgi:putative RNA 2'-phosphotransferase